VITTPVMDPSVTSPNRNISVPVVCGGETVGDNEDMPSLDALSFEHELCTSQNCHCHMEPSRRDKSLASSSSPFGFCSGLHPPVNRPLTSSPECAAANSGLTNGPFPKLESRAVFDTHLHRGPLTGYSSFSERLSEKVYRTDDSSNSARVLFGADHCNRANFHSFSQLVSQTPGDGALASADNALDFQAAQFQSFTSRGAATCGRSAHPKNELDLSELQSVLEDSTDEPIANFTPCPIHLQQNSYGLIQPCTCAQQAAKFDDWTVDELAGYFDDFCHIPKKMSAMAEMMYM
jgi:hypothetical protein